MKSDVEIKMSVRLALPSDEVELIELLKEMHEEGGIGSFSEAKARAAVETGLRREMAIIGVIRRKQIEASIGLFMTNPTTFSHDAVLSDLWSYVRPEWRKSTRAKCLLEFAKNAAMTLDRPLMMMAINNERTARKVELLGRQLSQCGTMFLYDPRVAA